MKYIGMYKNSGIKGPKQLLRVHRSDKKLMSIYSNICQQLAEKDHCLEYGRNEPQEYQ